MLLIDRVWSKVVAILLSSYFPLAVIREAWIAVNSGSASFDIKTFASWFIPNANVDEWPNLCLDLAIVILGYASYRLIRSAKPQVSKDA